MSNVVTSLVAGKPKILILCADGEFSTQLKTLFISKDLSPTIVDPKRLIEYIDSGRRVLPDQYYKIVWAYGFTNAREDFTKIIQFLRQREEPILVLTTIAPKIETDEAAFAQWALRAEQDRLFLLQVSLNLPTANLIFGEEILLLDNLDSSSLGALGGTNSDSAVLNPQIPLRFSLAKTFLSRLEDKIFNPFTNQKLFYRGQILSSQRIVEIINQTVFERVEHTYQVVDAPVRAIVDNFPFSFETVDDFSDVVTGLYTLLAARSELVRPVKIFESLSLPEIVLPSPVAPSVKIDSIDLPLPGSNLPDAPIPINPLPPSLPSSTPLALLDVPIPMEAIAPPAPQVPAAIDPKVAQFLLENDFLEPAATDEPGAANDSTDGAVEAETNNVPDFGQLSVLPVNAANQSAFDATAGKLETKVYVVDDESLQANSATIFTAPGTTAFEASSPETAPSITSQDTAIPAQSAQAEPELSPANAPAAASPPSTSGLLKKNPRRPLIICLIALGVIGAALLAMTFFSGSGYKNELVQFLTTCDDLLTCDQDESYAKLTTSVARQQHGFWKILPGQDKALLTFGQQLVDMSQKRSAASSAMVAWYQATTNQNDQSVAAAADKLRAALDAWLESVNVVRDSFGAHKDALLDVKTAQQLPAFENGLTLLRQDLALLNRLTPLLEDLARQDQYTLALNLLDNRALRSGGGLAAGVTVLDFNQGKLTGKQFLTSEEITAKLGGDIILPPTLENIAPDTAATYDNLFWGIDGLADATTSASLLEKVINRPVAGLAAYSAVSAQNDIWTQYPDAEINNIQSALYDQATTLSGAEITDFLLALARALGNKDFYWFSFDSELATRLAELGFDNRPATPTCPLGLGSSTCLLETFYQIDNNLDPNFDSRQLVRTVTHSIELLPTHITHERTIAYKNQATTGSYLAHIRFLLPTGATSTTLTINGTPASLDDLNGAKISVPANAVVVVKLNFITLRDLSQDDFIYSFFNQRQPGIVNSELSVNVRNSLPFAAKRLAPTATIDGKRFRFSSQEQSDFLLGIAF